MRALPIALAATAITLSLAATTQAQVQIVRTHQGTASNERYGGTVELLGDLDGSVNGNYQGAVYVFHSQLGTGFTGFYQSNLGWSVANIGDPGNGAHSVVAGAPALTGGSTALIEVYKGRCTATA